MAGLSRFDFYPRDWHLDTRDLSAAAKGVYIDLLAAIYARGGPLPMDEREICRLCGCATVRSLRPLLSELITKAKLKVVDGHLTNGRAMEEIAKAAHRQAVASEGGKAKGKRVRAEFEPNSSRTQAETRPDIVENQRDSVCSPSPSPSYITEEDKSSSAAGAADLRKKLYDLGRQVIGRGYGGVVTNLTRHHDGDLGAACRTLERARDKACPRDYVAAILRGAGGARADDVLAETDRLYRELGVS